MKSSSTRRSRRRPSHQQEPAKEQKFFGPDQHTPFFNPATALNRAPEEKKEEKVAKAPEEKKEEKVAKAPEEKQEEKVSKAPVEPEEKRKEEKDKKEKVNRKADKGGKDEHEEKIAKKGEAGGAGESTVRYVEAIQGKGQPLPSAEREFFGDRMGYDFSAVRIHTGEEAAESARDAQAKAYTYGNHIVFNEGRYDTGSHEGRKLLAHELAHVAQNGAEPASKAGGEPAGNPGAGHSGKAPEPGPSHAAAGVAAKGRANRKIQRGILDTVWGAVTGAGGLIWDAVTSTLVTAADILMSAGAWVWDVITWAPSRVWRLLCHFGSGIVDLVTHLWSGFLTGGAHLLQGLMGIFGWIGEGVQGLFGWIWRGLQGGYAWAKRLLHGDFSAFWEGLGHGFAWLADGVGGLLQWGWKGLEGVVAWALEGIPGLARWCYEGLLSGLAWTGRFIAMVFDLIGAGELWTLFCNILFRYSTRTMNDVEKAEAKKVYAGSIAYWQVRINERSLIAMIGAWFQGSSGMAVTTAHTINFTRSVSCAPGSSDMVWLIHELGHVAQYTAVGLQYLGEALHSQATGGYDYGGGAALAGKDLADFNREQQCDILEHYYDNVLYGSSPYASDYTRMKDQAVAGQF